MLADCGSTGFFLKAKVWFADGMWQVAFRDQRKECYPYAWGEAIVEALCCDWNYLHHGDWRVPSFGFMPGWDRAEKELLKYQSRVIDCIVDYYQGKPPDYFLG